MRAAPYRVAAIPPKLVKIDGEFDDFWVWAASCQQRFPVRRLAVGRRCTQGLAAEGDRRDAKRAAVAVGVRARVVGHPDRQLVLEGAGLELADTMIVHDAGVGHQYDLRSLERKDARALRKFSVVADHGTHLDRASGMSRAATENASPGRQKRSTVCWQM